MLFPCLELKVETVIARPGPGQPAPACQTQVADAAGAADARAQRGL